MFALDLGGKWRFKRIVDTKWQDAVVPGSVFNDLLANGMIDNPFYRDNEDKAKETASYDYIYEREFNISPVELEYEKLYLRCEGLDTLAEITINGCAVANTCNMHRTYELEVKKYLHEGSNTIRIIFYPPLEFIARKHREQPVYHATGSMAGNPYIRKAHYMFGWDWGPQIPDCGIWRNISIVCFNTARLDDVYITQVHENGTVLLDTRVKVNNWTADPINIEIVVKSPDGEVFIVCSQACGLENHLSMHIANPSLWWPNGYGKQPLYRVEVKLTVGNILLDKSEFGIGLRKMRVKNEKDQWGESFEFEVNGVSIFAMGADYIPEDNLLSRCSPEKTERLIKDSIKANFNCLRVWGGGIYPEDYFFDLCDRYGLVVWHDLMFACAVYEMTDEFADNIIHEAQDNIKRIRHHASLGLWCGNNEMEWGWDSWGFERPPRLRTDYIKQFEVLLPQVARETDPNTFYWPSSPSSGGSFDKPNDENRGDVHYWEVWHGLKPFTEYRKHYFRFCSEFGFQSFPCLKTVESFTLPEDRNVFSYVMEKHQKNGTANGKILFYLADNFKYPKDFDSLLYTSQILQAEAIKYGVEHWRRNRGRCMGAVYWQLNDCWPVASWASIDSFGRWKALHYFARRFFAPVLLSACEDGTKVGLHVTNGTMEHVSGVIDWKLMDNRSTVMKSGSIQVEIAPLSASECDKQDFADILKEERSMQKSYLEYSLTIAGNNVCEGTLLFSVAKHFEFLNPKLQIDVKDEGDRFVLNVSSCAFAKYVELDLKGADCIFQDNYFDLSAGVTKRIEVLKESMTSDILPEEFIKHLSIRSIIDIAE